MEAISMNILKQIEEVDKIEPKTLSEKVLKATEEIGELAEAVLSSNKSSGCGYKNKNKQDILEESVDLAIVAISVALEVGTTEEITQEFEKKISKWKKNITKFTEINSMYPTDMVEKLSNKEVNTIAYKEILDSRKTKSC